jgi:hypothetical protein
MSPTTTSGSPSKTAARRCEDDHVKRSRRGASPSTSARRGRSAPHGRGALGRYCDWRGRSREIVTLPGAGKSVLVLDRDATTLGDRRLLAHLAADEPPENAELVSRCFLRQVRRMPCSCRPLTAADLRAVPFAEAATEDQRSELELEEPLHDASGRSYRIERVASRMSIPELRWCRRCEERERRVSQPLSVRETVACLERYEPVLASTRRAVASNLDSDQVSIAVIRAELLRTQESSIVLNRALRAAVLDAVERCGQSMSEIAMRCGRVKRDSAGNVSGETSWLARRLGLLPEGGRSEPTPWVHSDVLALIARDGLGLSPREVEAD